MIAEALLIGFLGGVLAGTLGVGGGILFVPALTIGFSLSQLSAEATSLLAIVPAAAVGTWRQASYGNVALREGVALGVLSAGGALVGVALTNLLPQRVLELAFATLLLAVAVQLASRAVRSLRGGAPGG
ncbi:MAG TPA: sulfite exporter TauE/SafE family protein [Solirubrobacteraceae bacterium]|nr:sulfite exporter TauE/SafE family protein [Solirubrobacteraceae bacterium]